MQWLQNLDVSVFRFINGKLANPIFDQVMPFLSGNVFFYPALIVLAGFIMWKYRGRGMVFFLLLALAVGLTDGVVCRTIKHAVGRDRPFVALPDVRCLLGQGGSGSMPSSHAANWFAATMVGLVFFRRSLWIMLPLAVAVSFSRVYCGVHYPSDVMAGAILGAGTAAATLWLCTELWIFVGRRWFPLWWEKFPLLIAPPRPAETDGEDSEEPEFAPRLKPGQKQSPETLTPRHVTVDQQWLRLGYLVIAFLLVARLLYAGSDVIQLSPREAAQWLLSRQPANFQMTDSPLGFLLVWAGTLLFGDTQFGVRLFAPILTALTSVLLLRFFGRFANARAGFFVILFMTATPMLAAGGILLQPDFLRVFLWTACFVCAWRAVQSETSAGWWTLTGLCAGILSLNRFPTLFPLASLLFLFVLLPAARRQLKRPGPWIAVVLSAAPIALAAFGVGPWHTHLLSPTVESEPWSVAVQSLPWLNPIWLILGMWAAVAFWRRNRHNPLLLFFFCTSVPALAFALTFDPGWARLAAPAVALLCLMTAYWDIQWRLRSAQLEPWLGIAMSLSLALTLLGHETNWVEKLAGFSLPVKLDPLAAVRGWREAALVTGKIRDDLEKQGQPVFVIAQTLELAGELSFYLPEAKTAATDQPLVYVHADDAYSTQLPGYSARKSENAIFVMEVTDHGESSPGAETRLRAQFESATDLGIKEIKHHGQTLRRFQFFACRNLR